MTIDAQHDLFAQAPPYAVARNTDPETSHAAARKVEPHLAALCLLATGALRAAGPKGATTKELAATTGHPRDSISPRMRTLANAGICVETDERRDGCIVWRAL